jgi:hypothetical protein
MRHLRILKLANFALGAYTFIFGSLVFVMFVLPGWMAWGDGEPMGWVFILAGLLVFLLLGGLGLAHVVAGYLVSARRGRGLQTALAIIQLTSFPVGTAYALYALYACWVNEEACRAFDSGLKPYVS